MACKYYINDVEISEIEAKTLFAEAVAEVGEYNLDKVFPVLTDKINNYATQKVSEQESVQGERKEGSTSGAASQTSSSNSLQREKKITKAEKIEQLKRLVRKYNEFNFSEKRGMGGNSVMGNIRELLKQTKYSIKARKKGNISLLNERGKQVKEPSIRRTPEEIAESKRDKEILRRALNMDVFDVYDSVVQDIAMGLKFNRNEFYNITGIKDIENPLMFDNKKGQSFEFYALRMKEKMGDLSDITEDTVSVADEAANVVAEYVGKGGLEAAREFIVKRYLALQNFAQYTPEEYAEMEAAYGAEQVEEFAHSLDLMTPEELDELELNFKKLESNEALKRYYQIAKSNSAEEKSIEDAAGSEQEAIRGKEKIAKGIEGLISKYGGIKTLTPQQKTSLIQDVRNILEGTIEYTYEEIKALFKPFFESIGLSERDADEILFEATKGLDLEEEFPSMMEEDTFEVEEPTEGKKRETKIGQRAMAAPSEKLEPELKERLKEKGIDYIQKELSLTENQAKKIIEEYDAKGQLDYLANFAMNPEKKFATPDVKVALLTEIGVKYSVAARNATGFEREALLTKATEVLVALQNYGKELGRGVNAFKLTQKLVATNPEMARHLALKANQLKTEGFIDQEAATKAKKAIEGVLSSDELDTIVKQKVEEATQQELRKYAVSKKGKEWVDKVDNALDAFQKKLRGKVYDATLGIPVAVLDTSITIIRKALYAGASLVDAIDAAVNEINKKHKDTFNEKEFRDIAEEAFGEIAPKAPTKERKRADRAEALKSQIAEIDEILKDPSKVEKNIADKEKRLSDLKAKRKEKTDEIADLEKQLEQRKKKLAEEETKLRLAKESAELSSIAKSVDASKKFIDESQRKIDEKKSKVVPKPEEVKALENEIKLKKKLVQLVANMDGFTDKQKKDIIFNSLDIIAKSGMLPDAEFQNILAGALGLDHITKAQEGIIRDASEKMAEYEAKLDEFNKNPNSKQAQDALRKAEMEARAANTEFSRVLLGKGNLWDLWSSAIRGALLGTPTAALSFASNLVQLPTNFTEKNIATGIDIIRANTFGRLGNAFPSTFTNPFFSQNRYNNSIQNLSGFPEGIRRAVPEILQTIKNGNISESVFEREMGKAIRPLEAWGREIAALKGEEKIKLYDHIYNVAEGTLGLYPEAMFRMLAATDIGFRTGEQEGALSELANLHVKNRERVLKSKKELTEAEQKELQEIKDGTLLKRLLFDPNPDIEALAELEGLRATFQNKNRISKGIQSFSNAIGKDIGEKTKGVLKIIGAGNLPFYNMPINFMQAAIMLRYPWIPFLAGTYKYAKGDIRRGNQYMALSLMGAGLAYAFQAVLSSGALSGGEEDKKKKGIIYQYEGGENLLNVSKLSRRVAGTDKGQDWKQSDWKITYNQLGTIGFMVNMMANEYEKEGDKMFEDYKFLFPNFGYGMKALTELPMVLNTSLIIDAMKSGDDDTSNKYLASVIAAIASPVAPNMVQKQIRAVNPNSTKPELKDESAIKWAKNTIAARWGAAGDLPRKLDIWGREIKETPTNSNPLVYNLLDFARGHDNADAFGYQLYQLKNRIEAKGGEKNKDLAFELFPEPIKDEFTINGETYKLTRQQQEQINKIVGARRRNALTSIFATGTYGEYDLLNFYDMNDEEKVQFIRDMYNESGNSAKEDFIANNKVEKVSKK